MSEFDNLMNNAFDNPLAYFESGGMAETYTPRGKTAKLLERSLEIIENTPYRVSVRWLFYRLLQEGFYSHKDDYKNKYLPAVSKARHAFYNGWHPDTLEDDTRESIQRNGLFDNVTDWIEAVSEARCSLDMWKNQPVYIECWFEARAMASQFKYYTKHINLRPMGGQPSIPYKWDAAKNLEDVAEKYTKPIAILYFGDLDNAGMNISNTVEFDIGKWCTAQFDFVRCGLTIAQAKKYNVPENPEKPGQYQWEALDDRGAKEIITSAVNKYISHDGFTETETLQYKASEWLKVKLEALSEEWGEA